jgi:protein SCO1
MALPSLRHGSRPTLLVRAALTAAVLAGVVPAPLGAHGPAPAPDGRASRGVARDPSLAVIRPAPDFALLDTAGRTVRLSDLRGRVVLMAFIYASCPDACPLLTQRMAVLQSRLRRAGLFGGRVVLLSVTVDPERDTATALARYAAGFGADRAGWWFLREAPDRLAPALAAYDEWLRRLPGGDIEHPARLHLVDPRGRVREIYNLALFDERQALADIQALLREPA